MEVNCNLCNHYISLEEYDRHFKKCSAIKYIQKKTTKLYNKEIEYSELYRLDEIEFNKRYFMLLNRVYEQTTDERERKLLENILYGADHHIKEIM